MRFIYLIYGFAAYLLFFYTMVYTIVFVGKLQLHFAFLTPYFPSHVDNGVTAPIGTALGINIMLLALFGLQHSIMARRGFKRVWTKIIPQPIERSTFVVITSLILLLIFWQWRPISVEVWSLVRPELVWLMYVLFTFGWGLVFYSSFLINHFDLFGLRQVFLWFKQAEYTPLPFQVNNLYHIVRHPLYLGILFGVWATPLMTCGHLVFSLGMTIYIFIGMHFEEKDMLHYYGEDYQNYKKNVAQIIPWFRR